MIEIEFIGRGGQGVVTLSEMISEYMISNGKWAQSFPLLSAERRGAIVKAFCRVSDKKIYLRQQIYNPDILISTDNRLYDEVDFNRMKDNGILILNIEHDKKIDFINQRGIELWRVDATSIAQDCIGKNITSTAMFGAVAKALGLGINEVNKIIDKTFPRFSIDNKKAASEAYNLTYMSNYDINDYVNRKTDVFHIDDIPIGGAIKSDIVNNVKIGPGSMNNKTGTWTSSHPFIDRDKCKKCYLCCFYCPDGAISASLSINTYYCKGCGICVNECPSNAISFSRR